MPGCSNRIETRHVSVRLDMSATVPMLDLAPRKLMRPVPCSRPPFLGASRLLAILALVMFGLSGCATKPPADDPDAVADYEQTNDPLEPTNRVFYAVNNGLDTVILRPAALAYRYVVPGPVREGVHNVLSNIGTPVQLSNDILEGKPRRAGDTTMRFLINTTAGVFGIFDVATKWGYPNHDADFGMTLALWGVPEGPFLFLPVLGPTDPRDASGFGVDIALDPFTWIGAQARYRADVCSTGRATV